MSVILGDSLSQRSFLMNRVQRRIHNLDTKDFLEKTERVTKQDYKYLISINDRVPLEEYKKMLKTIIDFKTLN